MKLSFKQFVESEEANQYVDVNMLQSTLMRRLGSKMSKIGWDGGTLGTGIVAMVDKEDSSFADAVDCVNDFLTAQKMESLTNGKSSGELQANYRGAILSVVETDKTYKILITK